MMHSKEIDLSEFWCWNMECPDYRKKGKENIVLKERYGNLRNALLKCKSCEKCLSETRGTPFFGLKTPRKETLRSLAIIHEKGSIKGVARATSHDKNTIRTWLDIAGAHCKEVTEYFLHDLELNKIQDR